MIKYLNIRTNTVKLLEEHTNINLLGFALESNFLDLIQKAETSKVK